MVIFVLGKLPYPHCFLWNKVQMPKLKLLYLVKMDICILFATNAKIDAAHFCNVFPQLRLISSMKTWHKVAHFVCLATLAFTLYDHVFAYSEAG